MVAGAVVGTMVGLGLLAVLVLLYQRRGKAASSAKTRGFHTQLDEGPETP